MPAQWRRRWYKNTPMPARGLKQPQLFHVRTYVQVHERSELVRSYIQRTSNRTQHSLKLIVPCFYTKRTTLLGLPLDLCGKRIATLLPNALRFGKTRCDSAQHAVIRHNMPRFHGKSAAILAKRHNPRIAALYKTAHFQG